MAAEPSREIRRLAIGVHCESLGMLKLAVERHDRSYPVWAAIALLAIPPRWRGLVWLFIGPRPRLAPLRHARAARRYMFVHKPITRLNIRTLAISIP